jgi:hypothetical protein
MKNGCLVVILLAVGMYFALGMQTCIGLPSDTPTHNENMSRRYQINSNPPVRYRNGRPCRKVPSSAIDPCLIE